MFLRFRQPLGAGGVWLPPSLLLLGFRFALLLPLLSCVAVLRLAVAEHQELSVGARRVGRATGGGDQTTLLLQVLEV